MSSDYYFTKWRETLTHLEELIHLDQEFQNSKAHDKKRCDAVIRLCGMLGEYIVLYNDAMECWQQNLQVQKTRYMFEVVRAVTNRILELKHSIRTLEFSDTQFLGHGLAHHKLTTYDAEMDDVPTHVKRPAHVDAAITEAFSKAEERKELLRRENEKLDAPEDLKVDAWWDNESPDEESCVSKEEDESETEEMIQTRLMAQMIQAHERSRQLIQSMTRAKHRRERWEKELTGALKPPARLELRERSAKIIQKVLRAFFEIKRKKLQQCKEDKILGLRLCGKVNKVATYSANQIMKIRRDHRKQFEHQWIEFRTKLKGDFLKRKREDIADDYRDLINAWFRKWFDEIKYFCDIPREDEGGSSLIMKEEIPEPIEWWEAYQAYLEEKKANKNKSAQQLKYEQQEAKEEEMRKKQEEQLKKKLEEKLKQKLMKNPTMHPGFNYPVSKRTEHILEVINMYIKDWDELDETQCLEVKKKFIPEVDVNELYAEVKMDLMQTVDDDMRENLKILKKALKRDYESNEEPFPEPKKKPHKRVKKQKVKIKMSENLTEKLEDLAYKGILQEYPQKMLGDFLGDHNFAGDDMRCNYEPALHFPGETRAFWWERCREATHGFHKILVVGPPLSGKTVLVHSLATVTDAVLFNLDISNLRNQSSSSSDLKRIINSVGTCAKAAQPAVIHIKHIHRLFYKKVPPGEANFNSNLFKSSITKMLKKFDKTDRIAVIATCVDPWMTKSGQLLKQFPVVVLVPDMSYSAVYKLLSTWKSENHFLPRDLDIHSLAFVLRGYSYGHLMEGLKDFETADQIVRIAAYGLNPIEVYNYFLMKHTEKVDFEKYLKWYAENTQWGKKEAQHIEEQREFKRMTQIYAERDKKKKMASAPSSSTILPIEESDE